MALQLLDKRDRSPRAPLTPEQRDAVRAVARGGGDETAAALALAVIALARRDGLWLGCDCRDENGVRPVVAPCRNRHGTEYWRVLGYPQVGHSPGCVFHRATAPHRPEDRWNRSARKAPEGYFAVLRNAGECPVRSETDDRFEREAGTVRRPALSRRLLMLLERAGLDRLSVADRFANETTWSEAFAQATEGLEIAPGCPLRDLWFPRPAMWTGKFVHARVRAAARNWPARHRPQGFVCWAAREVDDRAASAWREKDRVEVVSRIGRPIVGRNPVCGPYLFIGAVGLPRGSGGYACLEAWAQPIVATDCPVPVDSHYERQALGTLRATLGILRDGFPDAGFDLVKPVFESETPLGPCIPDFVIQAEREGTKLSFPVEVMGFERPDYLQGKEVTHPRMETLGPLCTMDAAEFDRPGGVTSEGRKVTASVRRVLGDRWRR